MVRFHGSVRRQGSWISIFAIFLIGAGLLVYQRHYMNHHRHLIKAEAMAADSQAAGLLGEIGVPSGAQLQGGDEKRFGDLGRRSMWRGVTSQITWFREMEAPGDYDAILQEYSSRLQSAGWSTFDSSPPSMVKREFKKGKWFLTLWRMADFTHPTRTRLKLELTWDYWVA